MTERRRLAALGLVYDSPVTWASEMWVHTPRMAAKGAEHGFLYPRFEDHQLGYLVAFLRSVATRP